MLDHYHITALIPARGGSKRLPRKNVKLLGGRPLIAWSIQAAHASKYIDDVIVSTDDIEIKTVAKSYGAQVPFMRPESLSNDHASSFDVIKHAITTLGLGQDKHLIVLLQPTSPLRTANEIDQALELFLSKNANGVVSISETDHSPLWSNQLPNSLSMAKFIRSEVKGKRSQDLPTFYRLNGSIYIYKADELLKQNHIFYDENVYGYITSNHTSIDIDTEFDFKFAEMLLAQNESINR